MSLRTYEENTKQCKFYKGMYRFQDLDFVLKMKKKYSNLDNVEMTMNYALSLLDTFIDPSDPDLDEPNSLHAYQTAERIRKIRYNDTHHQDMVLICFRILTNIIPPEHLLIPYNNDKHYRGRVDTDNFFDRIIG